MKLLSPDSDSSLYTLKNFSVEKVGSLCEPIDICFSPRSVTGREVVTWEVLTIMRPKEIAPCVFISC